MQTQLIAATGYAAFFFGTAFGLALVSVPAAFTFGLAFSTFSPERSLSATAFSSSLVFQP